MAATTTESYLEEDSLCSFSVLDEAHTKLNYNLCPLWNQPERKKLQVVIDEDTPPTHTRNIYDIAAIGESLWDNTLPANLQVCLISSSQISRQFKISSVRKELGFA